MRWVALTLVVVTLPLLACSSKVTGPHSPEDLGRAVFDAIRSENRRAMRRLYLKPGDIETLFGDREQMTVGSMTVLRDEVGYVRERMNRKCKAMEQRGSRFTRVRVKSRQGHVAEIHVYCSGTEALILTIAACETDRGWRILGYT